jgi:integrase
MIERDAQGALPGSNRSAESAPPNQAARRPRRPRGTGSVYRLGKFWYVAYYVATGKQVTESSRSTLKTVAEHMLRDRIERVRQGLLSAPSPRKMTFEALVTDLLNDYRINRRRTLKDAECRIKLHLRPYFGNYLATAITTDLAKEYILFRRSEGAADGTIQQDMALLKRMFNIAWRAAKIPRVPYIPVPRSTNVRKGFVEPAAYGRLLAALPEYLKPLVQVAYSTGMRRGELVSLRWENVDLSKGQIRLNAGETKNGRGRVIPIGDELVQALKAQLETRNTNFPACPLVFFRTIKTKKNSVPSWLPIADNRKVWEGACASVGLAGTIFHDLRRSAVRNMVRAGVQERVAMRISGHLTRSVFDRYNIVSEDDLTDAVRKLQRFRESIPPSPLAQPIPVTTPALKVKPRFLN